MRFTRAMGAMGALLALTLLASCSAEEEPIPQPPLDSATRDPAYNAELEAAAAAMSLVPAEATALRVTDFEQIRLSLGFGDTITSRSPAAERARFWRQATARAPVLDAMLRDPEAALAPYGFGPDDVEWEAHFTTPSGPGWVLKFRNNLKMDGVARAAREGVGGLRGATVVADAHVAAVGATTEPTQSWAADDALFALVGQTAPATVVSTSCLPFATAFGAPDTNLAPGPEGVLNSLEDIDAFSVSLGLELITARLGAPRTDAFDRARLADILPATDPEFGRGYARAVADPGGGRIGFRMGSARVASRLAVEGRLPFAVCPPSQGN